MNALWIKWQNFWFEPQSPYPLAVFRIVFGLLLILNFSLQYLPQYKLYFGVEPIITTSDVMFYRFNQVPVFDLLLLLPQEDSWRLGFLYLCILLSLFMTLGLFTRIVTVVLFLCLLSLNNHFPMILHAGDNYCRLLLLFMCFAPSGMVLSLDRYFSKNKTPAKAFEAWPQRLMQVQLTYVYLINWIYKVMSSQWTEGSAVYYATRLTQYYRFDLPPLIDTAFGSMAFSWFTLIIEFALFAFIWQKKTRYWVLAAGALFHMGLDWCFNLGLFEWYFIASFILFVDPRDLKKENLDKIKHFLSTKKNATLVEN
ncbi:MAG: HTTM domain-containing protein [Candidatus Melainabacteria bacterium]|nr:HTTM domain-containing protein [Candidatus Melainabacteria bacterium]